MVLTKRIIPCLDVANGRVVKGLNFESIKDAGDPVQLAEKYSNEGADELVFLDITASSEQRETIKSLVKKIAEVIDIPFTVGGGVKSLQHARDILLNGADKVAINTGAVKNPEVITELMELFGKQCVVVAIDSRRNYNIEKGKNIFSLPYTFDSLICNICLICFIYLFIILLIPKAKPRISDNPLSLPITEYPGLVFLFKSSNI